LFLSLISFSLLSPWQDPKSSRTTLIGIGFRERESAFDFKNCLNEYIRFIDRMNLADRLTKMSHEDQEERERRQSHDFSNNEDNDEDHTGHDNTYQLTASKQQESHVSRTSFVFVFVVEQRKNFPNEIIHQNHNINE
jgi:hypothetical protein